MPAQEPVPGGQGVGLTGEPLPDQVLRFAVEGFGLLLDVFAQDPIVAAPVPRRGAHDNQAVAAVPKRAPGLPHRIPLRVTPVGQGPDVHHAPAAKA